jgi:hypothetical protein
LYSQNPTSQGVNLSPNGVLEKVYDRFGKAYKLSDIKKPNQLNTTTNKSVLINCSPTSIFNLYFEPGCGMDSTTDALQIARRAVVCQVFQDISDFINTPLTTTGNKVNIWVRNINNMSSTPNNFLGLATSFYNVPSSTTAGGISDGEVWKTITLGVDSFANVASPLVTSGANSNGSGVFYHGMVGFNFNTNNLPPVNWHTSLGSVPALGFFDLYTVALHEITHALGFASLIDENGNSKFGTDYKYYSRYDRLLKDSSNNSILINTGACSSMYNYNLNTSIAPAVLRPGCTLPNNIYNGSLNTTLCANAIRFVGTTIVPVYTPTCFEPASSLSHFEDQLFPSCTSAHGNDAYFVMSNANASATVKRYLKPEERTALCDIGYSVKTTYGTTTTLNGFYNYGGSNCTGITVAGVNDGLNTNGTFTFSTNQSTNITLSKAILLSNDKNATNLECVQDLTAAATITVLPTSIVFNSAIAGLHLLRYVPVDAAGKKGNITYIYVYVKSIFNCAIPTSCNLVVNGDFEQNSGLPMLQGDINKACGWFAGNGATPDYFYVGAVNPNYPNDPNLNIPCNFLGTQTSNNNSGNGYVGMYTNYKYDIGYSEEFHENIVTKLTTPLLKNVTYQLSFDVSLAEGASSFVNKIQAYFSKTFIPISSVGEIVIANPSMLLTNPTFTRITNGWQTISFTFTAIGGEQYLFLGGLKNVQVTQNIPAISNGSCAYYNLNDPSYLDANYSYYYLDNVNLIGLDFFSGFNLPVSNVCPTDAIADLSIYIETGFGTGVFSGNGVVFNNGVYSFLPLVAGIGTHTLCYTYTNINTGCEVKWYSSITVNGVATIPTFYINPIVCSGNTPPVLPNISLEDIAGTWSPATISNTVSGTYTFTPNFLLHPCTTTTTLAITVQNNANLIANPDTFTFPMQNVAQTTPSILLNDTLNGVLMSTTTPNIIISAGTIPVVNPGGFTFNANGTINILPGTPAGNYVLVYKLSTTCGISNIVDVNIIITAAAPMITMSPKVLGPSFCYSTTLVQNTTESVFDANQGGIGSDATINGVPCDATNVYFTNFVPPLPAGFTLNPDGTSTAQAGVLPFLQRFTFDVCPTATPGANCQNIIYDATIRGGVRTNLDRAVYNPSSFSFCTGANVVTNILSNDFIEDCTPNGMNVPASFSNCTFTQIGTNPYFSINSATGVIDVIGAPAGIPIQTLTYQLCYNGIAGNCRTETVRIKTSTVCDSGDPNFKMGNNNNGIKSNNYFDLKETIIAPNPSTGWFNILFNDFISSTAIEVYTLLGQKVFHENIYNEKEYKLDLSNFSAGTYLLKIINGEESLNKKIIIK